MHRKYRKKEMTKIETAQDTIKYVREHTDTVVLFNSMGKDSLVTLDLIAPHFKKIVNIFMYFVPHLSHVDTFISQVACRYNNIEILQIPHWTLSYIYRSGYFCNSIDKKEQRLINLSQVVKKVRERLGLEYVFLGMKKADGLNRRLMLNRYEENHYVNKGMCYPLATWTKNEVLAYMKQNKLPEPVQYGKKASNGVGFNLDCFLWMEKNAPQDLEKIYQAFPQSKRILFEYHYNNT